MKTLEDTIQNNRRDLEKEIQEISNKRQLKSKITLTPQTARKWDKVRNSLLAFTVMRKIFLDIKQYGTSMQALSISSKVTTVIWTDGTHLACLNSQVIEKCRNLLEMRNIERSPRKRLFYPDGRFLAIWEWIVFSVFLITATFQPFKIFFLAGEARESFDSMDMIDSVLDFLLLMNIFVKLSSV